VFQTKLDQRMAQLSVCHLTGFVKAVSNFRGNIGTQLQMQQIFLFRTGKGPLFTVGNENGSGIQPFDDDSVLALVFSLTDLDDPSDQINGIRFPHGDSPSKQGFPAKRATGFSAEKFCG